MRWSGCHSAKVNEIASACALRHDANSFEFSNAFGKFRVFDYWRKQLFQSHSCSRISCWCQRMVSIREWEIVNADTFARFWRNWNICFLFCFHSVAKWNSIVLRAILDISKGLGAVYIQQFQSISSVIMGISCISPHKCLTQVNELEHIWMWMNGRTHLLTYIYITLLFSVYVNVWCLTLKSQPKQNEANCTLTLSILSTRTFNVRNQVETFSHYRIVLCAVSLHLLFISHTVHIACSHSVHLCADCAPIFKVCDLCCWKINARNFNSRQVQSVFLLLLNLLHHS